MQYKIYNITCSKALTRTMCFNPFQATSPFLYLLKTSKNLCFSDFLGSIEGEHSHEIGQSMTLNY